MNHPEKSFAMRSDWVAAHPNAAVAITAAVIEAQKWCDNPGNVSRLAMMIAGRDYLKCPVGDIASRLQGNFNFGDGRVVNNAPFKMKFFAGNASFPYKSHDLWFLTEDQRWGKQPAGLNKMGAIAKVNRADIWRAAAAKVGGVPIPSSDSRGPEHFFDGKVFNPAAPDAYLKSLAIRRA
jgi:nitrate/nitrite transport system substrate-binding protein